MHAAIVVRSSLPRHRARPTVRPQWVLAPLLLSAQPALGQVPHPPRILREAGRAALEAQTASTVLDWTTVEVLVGADSVRGVYLQAQSKKTEGLTAPQRTGGSHYPPDAVRAWLSRADSVLSADEPDSLDPRTSVQTDVLLNLAGGGLLFGRLRQDARHWESSSVLYFAGSDGRGQLAIRGDTLVARAFLAALARAAAASAIAGNGEDPREQMCNESSQEDSAGVYGIRPVQIKRFPSPRFPVGLQWSGMDGRVLARYVVLPTGRADPASVDVFFASHPRFVEPVQEAIAGARFEPAWKDGAAIPMCVQQVFRFALRR